MVNLNDQEKNWLSVSIVGSLVLIVFLVMYFFLSYQPAVNSCQTKQKKAEESIKELEAKEKELQSFLEDTGKLEKDQLQKELARFSDFLPDQEDTAQILLFLNETLQKSRIYYTSIEPLTKGQYLLFTEQPIRLKLDCGYWELVQLIQMIENSPRFMRVKNLQITGKVKFRANLKVEEIMQDQYAAQLMESGQGEQGDILSSILLKLKKGEKISKDQELNNLLGVPLQHQVVLDISTYIFQRQNTATPAKDESDTKSSKKE